MLTLKQWNLIVTRFQHVARRFFDKEKLTWEVFKLTLGVEQMERLVRNLKYSMDNERKNG